MKQMRVVTFRAPQEEYDAWRRKAAFFGVAFSEFARRKLNDGAFFKVEKAPLPTPPKLVLLPALVRKERCDHRLPLGAYCKKCKKVKK